MKKLIIILFWAILLVGAVVAIGWFSYTDMQRAEPVLYCTALIGIAIIARQKLKNK